MLPKVVTTVVNLALPWLYYGFTLYNGFAMAVTMVVTTVVTMDLPWLLLWCYVVFTLFLLCVCYDVAKVVTVVVTMCF